MLVGCAKRNRCSALRRPLPGMSARAALDILSHTIGYKEHKAATMEVYQCEKHTVTAQPCGCCSSRL